MSKFKLYTNCRKRRQSKAPLCKGGCHGEAVTGGLTRQGASLFAEVRAYGPAPFTLLEPWELPLQCKSEIVHFSNLLI